MSWDTLVWRQADATNPEGIAPILSDKDLIRSAIEEAVSGMLMTAVTVKNVEVADLASVAELPDGFATVATFEMLGKERIPAAVALDPSGGAHLAGSTFDPGELGWNLAEALDQAVEAIAGEGLQAQMADGDPLTTTEPLVLLRVTFADAEGNEARLVVATVTEAPADLAMHLILVKEIGKIQMEPPKRKVAPAPVPTPEPVAAPAPEPAPMTPVMPDASGQGMPGGYPGYPGMPGGYPGMPGGYPAYPGYPGMPGGYPAYPGMPGGYPGYPGMPGGQAQGFPGAPGAQNGYPSNVRPLTLDELGQSAPQGGPGAMDLLYGVNLEVTVEIGRARLPIRDVLALTPGSIVELDKLAGEKVDVLVNGHLIASGEVVVVDDNFGVRITEVSSRARRLAMTEGAA